jgi:FkbM family methyltransferase
MTFISYAQNFEDVMLWRALKHISDGFYIDVGAAHPDEYSVTRAFYDRGWRGINIEPLPAYFHRLNAARSRDLNMNLAVADHAGELPFFQILGTGLSTVDRQVADVHRQGGRTVREAIVPVTTLAEVCRDNVRGQIHFMKIDVEGAEHAVLRGADFSRWRPWIVLVEATRPLSTEQNHEEWEAGLLDTDYRFVWFDGLNRFYIATEHWDDLSPAFQLPPNVFDDFVRAADTEQLDRIIAAETNAGKAEKRRGEAEARVAKAEARADDAEMRAAKAQACADDAEMRAAKAQACADDAEMRAAKAEKRAGEAEARATGAEGRAAQASHLEREAAHLKGREAQAKDRALKAEEEAARARASDAVAMQAIEEIKASTSWFVTAPGRTLKLAWRGNVGLALREAGMPLARIERLKRVGSTGSAPLRSARIALYGFGRFMARTPGGRTTYGLVGKVFPRLLGWGHRRYQIYYRAALLIPSHGDPAPLDTAIVENISNGVPAEDKIVLTRNESDSPDLPSKTSSSSETNLSAEEETMMLRLRAREKSA